MKVLFCAFYLLVFVGLGVNSALGQSQPNFSGSYKYECKNTPSGDYFGTLTLKKVSEQYVGDIINSKGRKFEITFLRQKGNRLIFSSNLEDTNNSILTCDFQGDSLRATIEVKGDDFLYKLRGKKVASH